MVGFYIFRCSTPKKERAGSKMTSSDEEKTGMCCRTCTGTVDTYPDVIHSVTKLHAIIEFHWDPFLWIVNF